MSPMTFEEKVAYYNKVKLANFRASARLEGINVPESTENLTLLSKEEIQQRRQKILDRYLKPKE